MEVHTVASLIWLPGVLVVGNYVYISVQGYAYIKESDVFRPTSSIELWSKLDIDMDTLCGGTENTHTLPQGVAGRMVVLG